MKKLSLLYFMLIGLMAYAQIPAGYYDSAAGLTGAALKTRLSAIISAGARDNGYGGLYNGYPTTDSDHYYENDGTVLDMYSEKPVGTDPYTYFHGQKKCGNYSTEGDCYNREHIVPQSLFNSNAPMVSDIHFIRPTDGKVNGMRSNFPFGPVGSASFTSKNGSKLGNSVAAGFSGTVFEPIDEFKGDIARMVLYFVTRYESRIPSFSKENGMLDGTTYPSIQKWELDVLLKWSAQDPVSPTEIERNNASYAFQGNRNPFIDHPEYVQQIWGSQIADTQAPSTPTNLAVTSTSTASADLTWTASTDNVAVSFYKIYVNGAFKANSNTTTATVSGLMQGTTYNFYVVAVDAAGNTSAQSNTATGTTLTDTVNPTAPTALTIVSTGTNNINLQWTAATDNVAVATYDIYVNSVLYGSTADTAANISNLTPGTSYSFYVVAKDAAGNISEPSNTVSATTATVGSICGNENFETIPANASSYSTYNWTSNGISWTSVDSRTDQTINGRAITIRDGSVTALSAPNGIGSLTVTTQLKFSGSSGTLNVLVNDVIVGSVPYSVTATTTTISGINKTGNVKISLVNAGATSNRIAIDDMSWTCFSGLGTSENACSTKKFSVFPNPVRNGELNVSGENLSAVSSAQILTIGGQLVQTIEKPFKNSTKVMLNKLPKGVYILKADGQSAKFIVE